MRHSYAPLFLFFLYTSCAPTRASYLAVDGGEDAGLAGLAALAESGLAVARQRDAGLQPFGVGDDADLYEHALQLNLMQFVLVAVLVGKARHLRAVAEDFGGQRRGDDPDVGQAGELALQHRVGAKLAVEFDQRHMGDDAGEVDRSEEHTSELQSLMRISYAVFCLKKKN